VATEDLCEEEPVIVIMRLKLFADHEDANNDDEGGFAGIRALSVVASNLRPSILITWLRFTQMHAL
jgi:hypothetical protein